LKAKDQEKKQAQRAHAEEIQKLTNEKANIEDDHSRTKENFQELVDVCRLVVDEKVSWTEHPDHVAALKDLLMARKGGHAAGSSTSSGTSG